MVLVRQSNSSCHAPPRRPPAYLAAKRPAALSPVAKRIPFFASTLDGGVSWVHEGDGAVCPAKLRLLNGGDNQFRATGNREVRRIDHEIIIPRISRVRFEMGTDERRPVLVRLTHPPDR